MTDYIQDTQAIRHERFRASLPQRRVLISERWIELRMVRWTRAGADQLRNWLRELAEDSTEFGYLSLGDLARELKQRLENALSDQAPGAGLIGSITAGVERMNLQIDQALLMAAPAHVESAKSAEVIAPRPTVLIADSDAQICAMVEAVVIELGFDGAVIHDASVLKARLRDHKPNLLIVDESLLADAVDDIEAAHFGAGNHIVDMPWILLSAQADIEVRLQASKAGASACLGKPLDVLELQYAVRLGDPARLDSPLRVLILADSPELAEDHAAALGKLGLVALIGAESAGVAAAQADQSVDVVLLDMQQDLQLRDSWLSVLADTPGLDGLPIVCMNPRRLAASCRLNRTRFLSNPKSEQQVSQALRKAVLENDREAMRRSRRTHSRDAVGVCTREAFMARLEAAIATRSEPSSRHGLLRLELEDALAVLRTLGSTHLQEQHDRLEAALLTAIGDAGSVARLGSGAMLALLPLDDAAADEEFMTRLRAALDIAGDHHAAASGPLVEHAVLLPLTDPVESAADACLRVDAALRDHRSSGGKPFQVIRSEPPVAAPVVSALPVERMYLHVRPLSNARGSAQLLHDASIRLHAVDGVEQPIGALLAEVVARGLAAELDIWEMNAVAAHLAALPGEARAVEISMRLSAASRESANLIPVVREIVSRVPGGRGFRLVFEVAETWLFEHNAAAVEMVEALRGLGCGVMLGDFGITDNPRNLGWAGWFDYARLSHRRMEELAGVDERRAGAEKLVRTAISRGARIIGGRTDCNQARASLAEWGVTLFD